MQTKIQNSIKFKKKLVPGSIFHPGESVSHSRVKIFRRRMLENDQFDSIPELSLAGQRVQLDRVLKRSNV